MGNAAISSTGKVSYTTPEYLLALVRNFFSDLEGVEVDINLDPCSNPESTVNASLNYQLEPLGPTQDPTRVICGDGLKYLQEEARSQSVFINPPFGRGVAQWFRAAIAAAARDCVVVMLVPDTPDTVPWKNEVLLRATGRCQIGHRVAYGGMETGIPKCCSFLLFMDDAESEYAIDASLSAYEAFLEHFQVLGRVESPVSVYEDQKDVKIWTPSKRRPGEVPPLVNLDRNNSTTVFPEEKN